MVESGRLISVVEEASWEDLNRAVVSLAKKYGLRSRDGSDLRDIWDYFDIAGLLVEDFIKQAPEQARLEYAKSNQARLSLHQNIQSQIKN